MLSKWPIRDKLLVGVGLLVVIVATLSVSGLFAVIAYRSAVKSFRGRADELPLAQSMSQQLSDLRVILADIRRLAGDVEDVVLNSLGEDLATGLDEFADTLTSYRAHLAGNNDDSLLNDSHSEWAIVAELEEELGSIDDRAGLDPWPRFDPRWDKLAAQLDMLQELCYVLPSYLHKRMHSFAGEVRSQYHALIWLTSIASILAAVSLTLLLRWFYAWIFRPLQTLVDGSRRVAGGEFGFRISLDSHDEMGELAEAMNAMTARFEAIRDDLDGQVRDRTKQVVRSEQMASVGFLAAGVAHEINNPLASIALCAESLESRIAEVLVAAPPEASGDEKVIRSYLRMIQDEAFRCKGITERLLDFARTGEAKRQRTELGLLVRGVIDMVGHLGSYHDKHIKFEPTSPVVVPVNPQEIKQVVLNLITNALDSLSSGGTLQIELSANDRQAQMIFTDNGCGMNEEVLTHLFEPFFTRRRNGQGTGLGLSITYRIVADHGGQIDVHSDGAGRGSRFTVTLPMVERMDSADVRSVIDEQKETIHRYQAA